MKPEFTVGLIDQKKELLYVAGTALTSLALSDRFGVLYRDGQSAKQRQALGSVDLTIAAILVDGNPVETVEAGQTPLLALTGDSTLLHEQAEALGWRGKSGRLLRTSQAALTLGIDIATD